MDGQNIVHVYTNPEELRQIADELEAKFAKGYAGDFKTDRHLSVDRWSRGTSSITMFKFVHDQECFPKKKD